MTVTDDAVVVVRDQKISGRSVVVTAERATRVEAWRCVCRIDGVLHDARMSDFPRKTQTI